MDMFWYAGSSAAVGHTMGAVAAFSMALSVLVYS